MKALQLRSNKLLVDKINCRGKVLFLLCFMTFLLNCETDPQNTTMKKLTLLVYMVADNNLMRRLYSEETLHVAFLPKTPLKKLCFFSGVLHNKNVDLYFVYPLNELNRLDNYSNENIFYIFLFLANSYFYTL